MEQAVELLIDKVTQISNTQEKILEIVDGMLKTQEEMRRDFREMVKRQDRMEETQKEMQEELTRIGNTVTIMENEHSQKIDLILEVIVGHTEKLEEADKKHERNKKVIDIHGHRIYALEQQKEK